MMPARPRRTWSLNGRAVVGFALAFSVLVAALIIVSRGTQRLTLVALAPCSRSPFFSASITR
jgi:hypothetical protein